MQPSVHGGSVMVDSVVQVVGDLYGCLLGDAPATAALDVLCSAMGAAHAIVMRSGPDCGDMFATSHHLADVPPSRLGNLDQSDEYRQLISSFSPGSTVRITDMMSRDMILRSDMYQTTLRPLDGGLALYGFQRDGADTIVTALCRSAAQDSDFDDDGVALLRTALPHLVAVTAIAGRMERDRRDGERAWDALDIVQDGVIVLDVAGRVIQANAAAEVLLMHGDRIRRTRSGISATVRADDLRLQHAIDTVRTFDRGFDMDIKAVAAGRPFQVVLGRRTAGWPLIATITPADRASNRLRYGEIVVHLRDSGDSSCLSIAALRTELGLTPREAILVGELAAGATLTQAATHMEISSGTARQYLKTIFLKTGVSGQADLLRLVSR